MHAVLVLIFIYGEVLKMDEETSLENWEVGAEPARGFESYLPRQLESNISKYPSRTGATTEKIKTPDCFSEFGETDIERKCLGSLLSYCFR